MSWLWILSALSLALWLYLLLGRDGFWRAQPRFEDEAPPQPTSWPAVVAVVPARNQDAHVGPAIRSLLAQNYPGKFAVVLVDDHSTDRTGEIARGLTLPGAASLYIAMTVDCAIRHRRGVGGRWMGRLSGPTKGERSEIWSPGR